MRPGGVSRRKGDFAGGRCYPRADQAFHRAEEWRTMVKRPAVVFSELLFDPDYRPAKALIREAKAAGFQLLKKVGHFFYYTLIFEKIPEG